MQVERDGEGNGVHNGGEEGIEPVRRLKKGEGLMVRGGMTLEEAKRRMGARAGAEAETGTQ